MPQIFYAVDLRLLKITVDETIGVEPTRRCEEQLSHYDGTLTEAQARDRYDSCDQILCAPRAEGV